MYPRYNSRFCQKGHDKGRIGGKCAECRRMRERHFKEGIETYLVRDKDGVLIYVGRTDIYTKRMKRHRKDGSEWLSVEHSVERVKHETYGESLLNEAILIYLYQPKYNMVGVSC